MNNRTILIIEDNVLNMKLLRCILQLNNFAVLEAENAEVGIQLAREHKPDMILMDIQLPDMDGVEATKLILNDGELKNTPIIAVSSLAMKSDKEYALSAGVKDYITKPINKKDLIDTIHKYLT
ncbi:MAG: response regulator [Desulfobacterales bacterium]|jgi:CheY-like chemotaxis protein